MNPRITIAGASLLAFIAAWEGVRYLPYNDTAGIRTVCYGNTSDVEEREYSPSECAAMLARDAEAHGYAMLECVTVELSQEEYEAYASFSYNVGVDAFCGSTLNKLLNSGARVDACNQLLRWNHSGGVVMRGLTRRRQAERDLCLRGVNGTS